MSLLIDASMAASWFIDDQRDPRPIAILDQVAVGGAIVPALFFTEFTESLLAACRKKRLTAEGIAHALQQFFSLPIEAEPPPDLPTALRIAALAQRHNISAYDAAYLEAALRRNIPLATHDRPLRAAAQSAGVKLP